MTTQKTCFKCGVAQPLDDFYRHPQMGDGHLNKCKACTKRDVRLHRANNDSVREYDRQRAKLPHRIVQSLYYGRKWVSEHPQRRLAQQKLRRAVVRGEVVPHPCWVCGEKAEAHHPDYSQPLDVVWLCSRHHKQAHAVVARKDDEMVAA